MTWPTTFRRAIYSLLLALVKCLGPHRFFHSRVTRRLLWDTAPRDALLLSEGHHERFLVACGDQTIGRAVYLTRDPFDFDKLEAVVELLKDRHLTRLVDIGANIGTICIPAVKRGLFQSAVAIEPDPRNFALLNANVAINGLADRIALFNVALGEQDDQTLTLELSPTNFGDHRASDGERDSSRESIQVTSQTLDRIVPDTSNALVWMDTQGFEGHVLAGASRALASSPPLVIEFWPDALTRSGGMSKLKQALVGYATMRELNVPDDTTMPFSAQALDVLAARLGGGLAQTDLLFL